MQRGGDSSKDRWMGGHDEFPRGMELLAKQLGVTAHMEVEA